MRLALEQRSLAQDFADFPVRKVVGVVALLVACAVLALRIHDLQSRNRVEFSERTAKFAIVKNLSDRLLTYSEQYGRPVFMWTGVHHASAAESTLYENLRLALLDERVRYWYSDRGYSIAWWDPKQARQPDASQIVIQNEWPVDAAYYARWRWYVNHPVPPRTQKPFIAGKTIK